MKSLSLLSLLLLHLNEAAALPSPFLAPSLAQHNIPLVRRGHSVRHVRRRPNQLDLSSDCASASSSPDASVLSLLVSPTPTANVSSINNSRYSSQATASPATFSAPAAATKGTNPKKPASNATLSALPVAVTNGAAAARSSKGIAASYFSDWNGDWFTPEQVDYSKFNLIFFAFAIPAADNSLYFTQSDSVSLLQRLVAKAHANGVQVVVSIGGWSGSSLFSKAVSTSASREVFANNMLAMIQTYNLDGVDLDWEYPGSAGATNDYASTDSANLAAFLKLLRSKVGKKLITMAASLRPFAGPNGSPLSSVKAQAQYLDHVLLMNYDVWGSSSTPGPNAPLANACGNSLQPDANAQSAVKAWTSAGMPANKLLLGLPSYGYISRSNARKLVDRDLNTADDSWKALVLEGQRRRAEAIVKRQNNLDQFIVTTVDTIGQTITYCPEGHGEVCVSAISTGSTPSSASQASSTLDAVYQPSATSMTKVKIGNGDLSNAGSQITFRNMIATGVIRYDSSAKAYAGINGYNTAWDSCSSTPFIYNSARQFVVTYDNPKSIGLKAAFAKSANLGGFGFWDMSGDSASYDLMRAARSNFGLSS